MKKSEKIKLIGEDFITNGNSPGERQLMLDVVCKIWNISIDEDVEPGLKELIHGFRLKGSPDGILPKHLEDSLKELELELRKMIETRKRLFPDDDDIIVDNEIEGDMENFVIRVKYVKLSEFSDEW